MNEKLLLILEVPAISQEFELLMPTSVSIKILSSLCAKAVIELSNGLYCSSGREFLCAMLQDSVLDENSTLGKYPIQNGDHLMLL